MSLALQSDILKLQAMMIKAPQKDIEVFHQFTPGLYSRTIIIPAGVCLVGALHKTEHQFVVSAGRCICVIHNDREEMTAPHFGVTYPGTKRVIYAMEETVFTTFHPTNETDLKVIEAMLLEPEVLQ